MVLEIKKACFMMKVPLSIFLIKDSMDYLMPDNLGEIQSVGPDNEIYLGMTFAPGIWAGTEGWHILIGNDTYEIVEVLFDDLGLRLNTLKGISPLNNKILQYVGKGLKVNDDDS